MADPLKDPIEAYNTMKSALKVVRRVIDPEINNPVGNTGFSGKPKEEIESLLSSAENHLTSLTAFGLFAAFERTLRDHLRTSLAPIQESDTAPSDLSESFYEFLCQASNNWRFDQVIEMFSPPVSSPTKGNAKSLQNYRNHVAHGESPNDSLTPRAVHSQLSAFLREADLV